MKCIIALLGALLPMAVLAAEGMWTLDNLPNERMQNEIGFSADPSFVKKLMQSSVRLENGCSGSFVSSQGLVLTNHHCVRRCVQQLSSKRRDLIADGFLARKRDDEQRCPAMAINRLEEITDVTSKVQAATQGQSGEAFAKAQKAAIAAIESECSGDNQANRRCEVVKLYQGGVYHLYRYRRFEDVRLVFAPEQATAFFGGDPDNFNFPRYNLDMALLRAYQADAPARIKQFFPLKPAGAAKGEATFITGHPGTTRRGLTVAQLRTQRDLELPQRLMLASEWRGLLTRYAAEDKEQARISQGDLFGIENGLKARKGMLEALQDPEVFAFKQKQEAELKAYVANSKRRKKKYGKAWDAIEKAQDAYRNMYWEYRMLEVGAGFASTYFEHARTLLRATEERAKPNTERLEEYGDARLSRVEQKLFSEAPIYPKYERVTLAFSLEKLREYLSPDHPIVKAVLGSDSPEVVAKRLVKATKLGSLKVRKKLWAEGGAAVAISDDPFIALARLIDGPARELRNRYDNEVKAVETANAGKIAAARFDMLGTSVYPDATFTLRLSYGQVRGWEEKGKAITPFTQIAGAFRRETGTEPFALPPRWHKAKPRLDLTKPFNFVTTNDIIGGNSGSPVINSKAEIVGLVFDGNIHSLGGAFWFDERRNRAVSVHAAAIVETMRQVYDAEFLLDEMNLR